MVRDACLDQSGPQVTEGLNNARLSMTIARIIASPNTPNTPRTDWRLHHRGLLGNDSLPQQCLPAGDQLTSSKHLLTGPGQRSPRPPSAGLPGHKHLTHRHPTLHSIQPRNHGPLDSLQHFLPFLFPLFSGHIGWDLAFQHQGQNHSVFLQWPQQGSRRSLRRTNALTRSVLSSWLLQPALLAVQRK